MIWNRMLFGALWAMMIGTSCNNASGDNDGTLAKVGTKVLTIEDVKKDLIPFKSRNDSIVWLKRYIKQWTEELVLLEEAKNKLSKQERNKDREVESYRNSLLIHSLEKKILKQAGIYNPSLSEIRDYYQKNRKEFELKKNILRLHYIKIRQNAPGIEKARYWFLSDRPEDIRKISDYAKMFSDNYFMDDQVWLTAEDIQKEIPVWSINPEDYNRNQRKFMLQDATYYYFIDLKDFRINTEPAPFDLVFQEIKEILINKRKVELVENYKMKVFRNAILEKKAVIYP